MWEPRYIDGVTFDQVKFLMCIYKNLEPQGSIGGYTTFFCFFLLKFGTKLQKQIQ